MIVEEYQNQSSVNSYQLPVMNEPVLVVLSAKKENRLKDVVTNLHNYLTVNREFGTVNLHEVAYTLQIGREAMEERLAVIAGSVEELLEKLKGFLEGQGGIEDLYRGQVKRNKDTLAVFLADEDMAKTIDAWVSKGKYAKLLDLWVKGLTFDWNKLYGDTKPRRISLPTYPFARERYWLPETKVQRESLSLPIKSNGEFNEKFYDELLEEITQDQISIKDASQKIWALNH